MRQQNKRKGKVEQNRLPKQSRPEQRKIAQPRNMERREHSHILRAGRLAQNPAIHRGRNAQRQHVEHQTHDHLAGADRDIHPGQHKVEDDAGQHSRQQADPNHAGYISGEEAGQGAQQNGPFNSNV